MSKTSYEINDALAELLPIVEYTGDIDAIAAVRFLRQRVASPRSYVAVIGETGSGKSTILNGFLKREIIPTSASPTTATVTEIICLPLKETEFYAINQDGSQESISEKTFRDLAKQPDDSLLRLQLRTTPPNDRLTGLTLFDTPGYNSVNTEHEEVLRDFIPNSDAIIYVAGYRQGFGQNDQDLLEITQESLYGDPDVPVFLLVNRIPEGTTEKNKRVIEIVKNAEDSIHSKVELFLIPSVPHEDDNGNVVPVLPNSEDVWSRIKEVVASPARAEKLQKKLFDLACAIIDNTDLILKQREDICFATIDDTDIIARHLDEYASTEKRSLEQIDQCFARLDRSLPKLANKKVQEIRTKVVTTIDDSGRWTSQTECVAFIHGHLFPFAIRKASKELEAYIFQELDNLNRELEDLANTAVLKILEDISIMSDAVREVLETVAKRLTQHLSDSGIKTAAASAFGGVGGYAAGVGNLAKMTLKRIGELFGKTFPRDVYTKIGRFFNKARTAWVIQIVCEGLLYVIDANLWKRKLKSNVSKALSEWENMVDKDIKNDLPMWKEQTEVGVKEIYSDYVAKIKLELEQKNQEGREVDIKTVGQMRKRLEDIKEKIGGYIE